MNSNVSFLFHVYIFFTVDIISNVFEIFLRYKHKVKDCYKLSKEFANFLSEMIGQVFQLVLNFLEVEIKHQTYIISSQDGKSSEIEEDNKKKIKIVSMKNKNEKKQSKE